MPSLRVAGGRGGCAARWDRCHRSCPGPGRNRGPFGGHSLCLGPRAEAGEPQGQAGNRGGGSQSWVRYPMPGPEGPPSPPPQAPNQERPVRVAQSIKTHLFTVTTQPWCPAGRPQAAVGGHLVLGNGRLHCSSSSSRWSARFIAACNTRYTPVRPGPPPPHPTRPVSHGDPPGAASGGCSRPPPSLPGPSSPCGGANDVRLCSVRARPPGQPAAECVRVGGGRSPLPPRSHQRAGGATVQPSPTQS